MGKVDLQSTQYFNDSSRYADLWNAVVYDGKEVISPDALMPIDTTSTVATPHGSKKITNDNAMQWQGKCLRILVQENQNYIDYRMVLRNMLTESMMYNKQYKEKARRSKKANNLKDDELLSGISKYEKFTPVITLVVNLSDKKWDAATNLYELFDIDEEPEIKNMISNYHLNIFDYHDYDNFDDFKTELRQVFSFLRYSEDRDGMKKILEADREQFEAMDEETAQLIEVLTKTKGRRQGGTVNMCKAFDDHYNCGKEEGMKAGREAGVKEGIKAGREAALQIGIQNLVSTIKRLTNKMDDAIDSIMLEYGTDREEAERTVRKYW